MLERTSLPVIFSKAPSLKTLQFCRTSTKAAPIVLVGPSERLEHVGPVHVVGAGHEGGLGPQRQRDRVERGVVGAERGRLGDLAHLGGRRVLPLGQPVNLVVEHQDVQAHVAAQGVDQVIAADGQRVPVAGDDPDVEIGAAGGQPGGDGRGAPVDRVHPVGVHVVRETGGTADAGEEDRVLPAHAERGHQHLHGGQDGVVTAPRAPAHLLVAAPVLAGGHRYGRGLCCGRHDFPPRMAVMAASISITRNGVPCILLRDWASTRNSARRIRLSWPMFISGTSTWL